MNRFLDFGMEILNAHAEAVETEFAKNFEVRAAGDAGIDFDADLGIGRKREVFTREGEEVFNLFGSKVGRCAAAPVELHHGAQAGDGEADAIDFFLKDIKIRRRNVFVFLNNDVACAEEAQTFAKGNVHVERNGSLGAVGFDVNFFEIVNSEGVVPDRRGWIAGVAWAGTVVAGEKFFADAKLFAHLGQGWVGDAHKAILAHNGGRGIRGKRRLLAGLDEELRVFNGRCRKNSVAKIQNVADATELMKNFFGLGA